MTNNPELKTWFDDALKQGHTIDELIPHLKEHGYTDEMIDPVVSELKAELNKTSTVQETATLNQVNSNSQDQNQESISTNSNDLQEVDNLEVEDQVLNDSLHEENILDSNESQDEIDSLDSGEDFNNDFESQDSLESIEETENSEENSFETQNQDQDELSLKEIEAELETQYAKSTPRKNPNLIKPIITSIILIAVLIGGYFVYPSIVSMINGFTQSTPTALPPTLPGNSFGAPEPQTEFIKEETQVPTSLEDNETVESSSNSNQPRRFKKELYFN